MKITTLALLTLLLAIGTAASQESASDDAQTGSDESPASSDDAKPTATAPATIDGEPPELRKLAGSYTLVGNQADSLAKIHAAIDQATAGMGSLKKKVARKRLENVNKAVVRLKISSVAKKVTIGMDNYVVTAPLDGGTAEVVTPTGDKATASFSLQQASLVQDIVAAHGRRENIFRFGSNGELLMHVRETSPQLSDKVVYTLVYKRAGQ
ncbi:MAG: hypothetical protein AAF500_17285 [Myxococcota bacterium]